MLHATLLVDLLLLQPQGLAYVQLDIARRRKYGVARKAYEELRWERRLKDGEFTDVFLCFVLMCLGLLQFWLNSA